MISSSIHRSWLSRIITRAGNAPIRLILWDGTRVDPPSGQPAGAVLIKNKLALLKIALDPELYFGEAYSQGHVEIQGDLVKILVAVYQAMSRISTNRWYPEIMSRWLEKTQRNTLRGSRRNIHHHYDIGTDFYKLWLDSQLVYTCAYFTKTNDSLEQAQLAKMDHVCRKVRLQPGDTVVEAGCGWGALAIHMAKHYGAQVKAFNISHEQIVYARERARKEGLGDSVEFIEDDYRNISGKFNVFVSVGMLEHIGPDHYADLGEVIHRTLPDSGRGFLHFIGRNRRRQLNPWIRKWIFPGAYPPTLSEVGRLFEPWDFSVLDIENLRLHYARTIEHWLDRFENSVGRVAAMFNPEFVRVWRLYLAGSLAAFRTGSLQLFQVVFTRSGNNGIPWSRAHLYAAEQFEAAENAEMSWATRAG